MRDKDINDPSHIMNHPITDIASNAFNLYTSFKGGLGLGKLDDVFDIMSAGSDLSNAIRKTDKKEKYLSSV